MAGDADRVNDFLTDLSTRTEKAGKEERIAMEVFAKDKLGLSSVEDYDSSYVMNLLREKQLNLDSKVVGEYFPADYVVPEVLKIYQILLGIIYKIYNTNIINY